MTRRAKLIQWVHIGAAKLFGDDKDARYAWQGGSCKDLDNKRLQELVDELKAKGALEQRPPKRAGRVPFNRSPYMDKIEAQLTEMGLSWQYAESIAWRITGGRGLRPASQPGVQRLEWVRNRKHFEGIIKALEVEQSKRRCMARIKDALKALGKDFAYIDTLVPEHMRGIRWQRHLPTLRVLVNHLSEQLEADDELA
jgi:hypothetical protein